jgi:hypothetical protein
MSTEDCATGDLYEAHRSPAETAAAIRRVLALDHPKAECTVVSRTTSTSWTIEVGITEHEDDLGLKPNRDEAVMGIRKSVARFGYDRSDPTTDHEDAAFRISVTVHEDYWSNRQAARLPSEWVRMNPSALMKQIRRDDALVDRSDGSVDVVTRSSNDRFVTRRGDGERIWNAPRAAALRRNGDRIRIARGSANDPDAHTIVEWMRS